MDQQRSNKAGPFLESWRVKKETLWSKEEKLKKSEVGCIYTLSQSIGEHGFGWKVVEGSLL